MPWQKKQHWIITRQELRLSQPKKDIIKQLFIQNLITLRELTFYFNYWCIDDIFLVLQKPDMEQIEIPIPRRGNRRFHEKNWSKMQDRLLEWRANPHYYYTEQKTAFIDHFGDGNYKRRKIYNCNTFMLSFTLKEQTTKNLSDNWTKLGRLFNIFMTNLKQIQQRRNNPIVYYISADEGHESGHPHKHILLKLKRSIPCYRIYNKRLKRIQTRLCKYKYLSKNWDKRHGHADTEGVEKTTKDGKDPISYITKYITKTTNTKRTIKETQTLSLQWILNKKTFSTTRTNYLKRLYPMMYERTKELLGRGTYIGQNTLKKSFGKIPSIFVKKNLKSESFYQVIGLRLFSSIREIRPPYKKNKEQRDKNLKNWIKRRKLKTSIEKNKHIPKHYYQTRHLTGS